jgi:hypothetical protein
MALSIFRANIVVTNCFVLAAPLVAGTLLNRQIGSVSAFSTILIVAAIVDLISTHAGPSRWLVDPGTTRPRRDGASIFGDFVAIEGKRRAGYRSWRFDVLHGCVSVVRRLGWPETRAFVVPLVGIFSALGVGLSPASHRRCLCSQSPYCCMATERIPWSTNRAAVRNGVTVSQLRPITHKSSQINLHCV